MHVLVTGASSGIGEAIARAYLERGASVTLVARRVERLEAIALEHPERALPLCADLTCVERAAAVLPQAEARFGPIDVLVNNAGASMVHPTVGTDWSEAEALLRLNVLTPFKLTCAVLPSMLERGRGCIVDISSLAALVPQPGFFFYSASKAALAAGSESLRGELRRSGVHVLTVYPGPVRTPMADANFAVYDPKVERLTPTGDVRTLARLVVAAVDRKRARVIYPRVYALAGWLPLLFLWLVERGSPEMKRPRTKLAVGPGAPR